VKKAIGWGIACVAVAVAIALFLSRDSATQEIVAAGPNPFVSGVLIEQIGEDAAPFGDTIEVPASTGIYVAVRLKRIPEPPATFDEREVSPPHLWPATLAVYRRGEPDGPGGCEFHCQPAVPTLHSPSRVPHHPGTPPTPPPMGTSRLWSPSAGFAGAPRIDKTLADENAYWTFLVAPDRQLPAGEYVYEVRLYPTTRWISPFRIDIGEQIVLKRGLLIAADA
jgi:hypothetical protein